MESQRDKNLSKFIKSAKENDLSELRKVDVRVTRLRQKIEKNAKQPQFIKE